MLDLEKRLCLSIRSFFNLPMTLFIQRPRLYKIFLQDSPVTREEVQIIMMGMKSLKPQDWMVSNCSFISIIGMLWATMFGGWLGMHLFLASLTQD